MLNEASSQKRRGRPRKYSINTLEVERMKQRLEISKMMDIDIYLYDRFDDSPILSRKKAMVTDLPIDTSDWVEYNTKLHDLLDEYNKIKGPAKYIQKIFSDDSDRSSSEEEEEENSSPDEELVLTNETQPYKYTKPPIEEFIPGSVESLPEAAQKILRENKDMIFRKGITYQCQIELVIKLIHSKKKCDCTGQTAIAKLFGISKGAIHTHMTRMTKNKRTKAGRPPLFDSFQDKTISEYVSNCYIQGQSPNIYSLIDMIFNTFSIYLDYHSIYNYIRNSSCMKTVLAPVYESVRAEVKLEDIKIYYERLDLIMTINQVPPSFVFNVDESGFIDFVDMRDEIVVVPIDAHDGTVKSADRNSKRATMVGAISLDGSTLTPLIVVTNKRYEKELLADGYDEPNVLVVYQKNGFINSKSFYYWTEQIFLPELEHRREKYKYQGEAILLLDGCSAHSSNLFLDECSYKNVYPFYEPAGASDQVQALDLGIFGVQKNLKTKIKAKQNLGPSSKHVQQIVNSWIKTTTPDVVVSAFNQAGIYKEELKDGRFIARASIEKARAVRNMPHIECKNIFQGTKTISLLDFDD